MSQIYLGHPFLIKSGNTGNLNKINRTLEKGIFLELIPGAVFFHNAKIISIDTTNRVIAFRNLFGIKKSYDFNDLDVYVLTTQRDGNGYEYKVIYLVKGEEYVAKITSFFVSNYEQMHSD